METITTKIISFIMNLSLVVSLFFIGLKMLGLTTLSWTLVTLPFWLIPLITGIALIIMVKLNKEFKRKFEILLVEIDIDISKDNE